MPKPVNDLAYRSLVLRLVLVCHAATAATRVGAFPLDEPVDAEALLGTQALAPILRRHDRAWSSPARRARETAAALCIQAEPSFALADLDAGRWAGHRLADIQREEPDALAAWLTDPNARPHGGETLLELSERAGTWLRGIADAGGSSIAVTHAAIVRAAVVHVLGAPGTAFWRIDVPPLSVSILTGSVNRWNIRVLGAPATWSTSGAG